MLNCYLPLYLQLVNFLHQFINGTFLFNLAKNFAFSEYKCLSVAARDAHISVLEQIEKCVFTEIFLVGDEFAAAFNELSGRQSLNPGTAWHLFTDAAQLYSYLEQNPLDSRTILVKGSNSMRLTTLLPVL